MSIKILIVEDNVNIIDALVNEIKKIDDSIIIEVAMNVADAYSLIKKTKKEGLNYFIAILDFQLPFEKGYHEDIDFSICEMLRIEMIGTIIIHMTAYPEDIAILDHINQMHTSPDHSIGKMVPKDVVGWRRKIIDQIKEFYFGIPIKYKLDKLFKRSMSQVPNKIYLHRLEILEPLCMTHELSDLIVDISANWDNISKDLQADIFKHFNIDIQGANIKVSLL